MKFYYINVRSLTEAHPWDYYHLRFMGEFSGICDPQTRQILTERILDDGIRISDLTAEEVLQIYGIYPFLVNGAIVATMQCAGDIHQTLTQGDLQGLGLLATKIYPFCRDERRGLNLDPNFYGDVIGKLYEYSIRQILHCAGIPTVAATITEDEGGTDFIIFLGNQQIPIDTTVKCNRDGRNRKVEKINSKSGRHPGQLIAPTIYLDRNYARNLLQFHHNLLHFSSFDYANIEQDFAPRENRRISLSAHQRVRPSLRKGIVDIPNSLRRQNLPLVIPALQEIVRVNKEIYADIGERLPAATSLCATRLLLALTHHIQNM